MNGKSVFVDSNIILYAYSTDVRKKTVSKKILRIQPMISTQVLNEVSNVALRKLKLTYQEVRELLNPLKRTCDMKIVTWTTIDRALGISEIYQYSYFDSLILASALEYQCQFLYTERSSRRATH